MAPDFTPWSRDQYIQAPVDVHVGLVLDEWLFYSNVSVVSSRGVLTIVDNPEVLSFQQVLGNDVIQVQDGVQDYVIRISVSLLLNLSEFIQVFLT